MPTSFADAEQKITARYKDNVPTGLHIAYDNVNDTQIRDNRLIERWTRLTIFGGQSSQAAMGSVLRRYRNNGMVIVQCFTKEGVWTKPAIELADAIAVIFRGVAHDGITYRAPSAEKIGPAGGWYQVNVVVPFYWDLDA